jgi:hypothetical protein
LRHLTECVIVLKENRRIRLLTHSAWLKGKKKLQKDMTKKRKDNEPPIAISKMGMRFHHIGIPTTESKPNEKYLEQYKFYVSGFETSEFGIEWMRFEEGSPISEIIQKIPHIAFEVDNLDLAIQDREIIGKIGSPSKGVRVAMIIENGAPVELIEFEK